jgi:urocanate hydratase
MPEAFLTEIGMGVSEHPRERVLAQRGTALRCRGWKQETILRMLENNLENGERPEDLVIYMSAARAARDWTAFDKIVAALKDLGDDETLLIQSGKPIARFRSHPRAPRVIMANGLVVGRWTDEKTVFELEQAGLTITAGMTAAAWQYIGSQGILQGTWQSFVGAAERFGGSLAGKTILTAGCGGMGGAQPLAGKMAGAATLVVEVNPARFDKRIATGYLDRATASMDEALGWIAELQNKREGGSVGLVGNVADVHEALLARGWQPDVVTDQVTVDPRRGYVASGFSPAEMEALVKRDPDEALRLGNETLVRHAKALVEFRKRGALVFEYGNTLRMRVADVGYKEALTLESFVTLFIRPLFCLGIGPFRWIAASGDPKDIAATDAIAERLFPEGHRLRAWLALAKRHVQFQGLPARIGWLGHGERSKFALAVNDAVASGEISAPIAFTRDHLDSGSVASPFRETEKMKDGSDPIADWPVLNALLATAMGADLVAVHANVGRMMSAGQTAIADGTPFAAERLAAVLDGDTGIGIARHADAGYEAAIDACDRYGVGLGAPK